MAHDLAFWHVLAGCMRVACTLVVDCIVLTTRIMQWADGHHGGSEQYSQRQGGLKGEAGDVQIA